jgi:hypothetical protein
LQSYNFTIIHRSGVRIPHADAISRCIQDDINEDDITPSSSHLKILENTITNSAKPPNFAEIDDFIDDKLMINLIENPAEQINLQIIHPDIPQHEQHTDKTALISPLKQLCLNTLSTPIIQSHKTETLESINNPTPHFPICISQHKNRLYNKTTN